MGKYEWKEVFEQIKPSSDQKKVMLNQIFSKQEERQPMKRMKKMTAVLIAAAILLMGCAFTVVTKLDHRILEYFGGTQKDAEQLAPGFVVMDLTSTADNGAEVHISQVYTDQRNLVLVGELTVPEGTVLNQEDYKFRDWHIVPKGKDGTGTGGTYGNYQSLGMGSIWTDENPDDNTLSFVEIYYYEAAHWDSSTAKLTWAEEIESLEITWKDLVGPSAWETEADGTLVAAPSIVSGKWSFEIPVSGKDFGWIMEPEQTIELEGEVIEISEIYFSPIGLSVRLKQENGKLMELMDLWESREDTAWGYSVTLRDSYGKELDVEMPSCRTTPYTGEVLLKFHKVIDPAQYQGGTVTVLGETISLDALTSIEKDE